MTTIYVVTSGRYSDYQLEAVFSTREKAVEVASRIYQSNIEEFELDVDPKSNERMSKRGFEAAFSFDGSLIRLIPSESRNGQASFRDVGNITWVFFDAQDEDHARKRAPELLEQWISEHIKGKA